MTDIVPETTEAVVRTPPPDDREPRTRRKGFFFDRIKLLLLLAVYFLIIVSYEQSQVPVMSWADAFRDQARAKWWLWIVVGLEVLRQIHYVVCEHWGAYHTFWRTRIWEGWERLMSRLKPYTRFRLARLVKRILFISVLGLILSWKWGIPFIQALAEAPSRWFKILFVDRQQGTPLAISILLSVTFSAFYLIFFYGIFFIGGVETFKPGEIKTRFADIWGQDHVVARVQENLDFLEAPHRMAEFFGGRLLRWLTAPYRLGGGRGARLVNLASRPFYQVADRILGSQFLEDIAEFFLNFQSMYDGFVERARAVERLLHDRRTSFVVVTTLEASPLAEAEVFCRELVDRGFPFGALVLNKTLPGAFTDPAAGRAATTLLDEATTLAAGLSATGQPALADAAIDARVLRTVAESFRNFAVVAARESELRHELARLPDTVVDVPNLDADVHDLGGLARIAESLFVAGP